MKEREERKRHKLGEDDDDDSLALNLDLAASAITTDVLPGDYQSTVSLSRNVVQEISVAELRQHC